MNVENYTRLGQAYIAVDAHNKPVGVLTTLENSLTRGRDYKASERQIRALEIERKIKSQNKRMYEKRKVKK